MQQIAEYIINDGAITVMELNETDTELWKLSLIHIYGEDVTVPVGFLAKKPNCVIASSH